MTLSTKLCKYLAEKCPHLALDDFNDRDRLVTLQLRDGWLPVYP
jgi:hypothetical protein